MVFVLNFAALTMGVVMISDDSVPSVNKHNTLKEGTTATTSGDDGIMKKAGPIAEGIYDVGMLAAGGAAVAGTDPMTGGLAMGAGATLNKAVDYVNNNYGPEEKMYGRLAGKAAVPLAAFGTVQGMNMMNEGAAAAGDAGNAEGDKPADHQPEEGHAAEEPAKEED